MPGKECYHCKRTVTDWNSHDCWTTTEAKLTEDLDDNLRDAWERIRETASDFGEQRIYASHNSIMFARTHCYFFVRPKRNFLEVVFFLGRKVKHPTIKKAEPSSSVKFWHLLQVRHRDEVEAPLTDWLREAYEVSETLRVAPKKPRTKPVKKKKAAVKKTKKKTAPKRGR